MGTTKIALLSDLHCEFDRFVPEIHPKASLCILAGDIHQQLYAMDVGIAIHRRHRIPVIQIAGNHEHYDADMSDSREQLRQATAGYNDVHFLEKDAVVIKGIRYLGTTLWTDFAIHGAGRARKFMPRAEQIIVSDFARIRYGGQRFTPADAVALFSDSYAWLEQELAKPFRGKTVVITHFGPHRAAINDCYWGMGSSDLTPYFTSDCSALMRTYRPALWVYGHTHDAQDVIVEGGTRLVSNPRGYPFEIEDVTGFDPLKLIEV